MQQRFKACRDAWQALAAQTVVFSSDLYKKVALRTCLLDGEQHLASTAAKQSKQAAIVITPKIVAISDVNLARLSARL